MDKPMTTADFFNKICNILKEKELFPDILDYALPKSSEAMPITTYEFNVKNNLDYGGNEGIYLDLWVMIYSDKESLTYGLGTFKTLLSGRDAMHTMGKLLADFIVETRAYVNANLNDFTWEGADICIFDENGNKLGWEYSCKSMESALKKKDELLQKYPHVVVRDNATRKETSYSV